MKVVHSLGKIKIEKEVKEDVSFLLANKIGGYLSFASKPRSKFDGFFINNNFRMFRIIESINIQGDVRELRNNFWNVERRKESINERFTLPSGSNSLIYEVNKESDMELFFDVKESYDSREWGRNYEIFEDDGIIIVKFTKKTDGREDSSDGKEEYTFYTAIHCGPKYEKINRWVKKEYEYDKKRNSSFERFVFYALKIKSKNLVISVSSDMKKAVKEAKHIFENIDSIKKDQKSRAEKIPSAIFDKEIQMARLCCRNSLENLSVKLSDRIGIYAGLPWFFQFWTRDEAVSLEAIMKDQNYELAKNIIMQHISSISNTGKLLNKFPGDNAVNADGLGWDCKRINELIITLTQLNMLKNYLTKKDLNDIKEKLAKAIDILMKNFKKGEFITNEKQETWMDSIPREGARIEIQALCLMMLELMYKLSNEKIYLNIEERLKQKVVEKFMKDGCLKDGSNDELVRPNIFIAAYIYPKLLSNAEWSKCFSAAVPLLWNSWGGMSTVDKTSKSFIEQHTGENSKSYHNGDSWFWMNNLAALVMARTDKKKFSKYTNQILKASTEEILWKGAIGHHAELSSSKELRSEGCWAQAWSAAMYMEMVDELLKN